MLLNLVTITCQNGRSFVIMPFVKIKNLKKQITLNDLAIMVAKGFSVVESKVADVESKMATQTDIKRLEGRIRKLERKVEGLQNSVNNYLKLTDKRYFELKNNQKILARYLKHIILTPKVAIDLRELETILK